MTIVGIHVTHSRLENSEGMAEGVGAAKSILRKHGSYNWLTEKGNLVILDNDAEFALLLVVLGGWFWIIGLTEGSKYYHISIAI